MSSCSPDFSEYNWTLLANTDDSPGHTAKEFYQEDGTAGPWEGSGWSLKVSQGRQSDQPAQWELKWPHRNRTLVAQSACSSLRDVYWCMGTYGHCSCHSASDSTVWRHIDLSGDLMLYAAAYHFDPVLLSLGHKRVVLADDVDFDQLSWVWQTVQRWSGQVSAA